MFRRLAARLRSVEHAGRVLVGEDMAGNKFYEIGQGIGSCAEQVMRRQNCATGLLGSDGLLCGQ